MDKVFLQAYPGRGCWTRRSDKTANWADTPEGAERVFKYPPEIRKAIYTTNAIESLNYQLRQVTKNRSSFSTDDAIFKILHLAIRNASKNLSKADKLIPPQRIPQFFQLRSFNQVINYLPCVSFRPADIFRFYQNLDGFA